MSNTDTKADLKAILLDFLNRERSDAAYLRGEILQYEYAKKRSKIAIENLKANGGVGLMALLKANCKLKQLQALYLKRLNLSEAYSKMEKEKKEIRQIYQDYRNHKLAIAKANAVADAYGVKLYKNE